MDLDVAIRLADEGVPLGAIARATRIPSSDLREHLIAAKQDGQLIELPAADWPPGFPRDQRALQLSRMDVEDKGKLLLAVRQTFRLSRAPAQLLLTLLQRGEVVKAGDMTNKIVDVHICGLRRRLAPYGFSITTVWGYGYQLPIEARRKAMEMVSQQAAPGPGLSAAEKVYTLASDVCRWPCGDPAHPDFHFCGSPVTRKPYCEHHRAMAYVAPPTGQGVRVGRVGRGWRRPASFR